MKPTILKAISALLALAMITVCFASCKDNGKEEDGPTKPTLPIEDPVTDAPLDLDNYTIPSSSEKESEEETFTVPSMPEGSLPDYTGTDTLPDFTGGGSTGGNQQLPPLTPQQIQNIIHAFGYDYDAEQDIFFSVMNPWQRHFGFGDIYDQYAPYANMRYKTIKIDFKYKDLLWRIQCWKGQYGILEGGEMGVYTKDPNNTSSQFYECASDENLLTMSFKYYKNSRDYNAKAPTFERALQEHWWLTGFKFGYCDPKVCVLEMTIVSKDIDMATGIQQGLMNVKGKNGEPNGFTPYSSGMTGKTDLFTKTTNANGDVVFKILWLNAGYVNYASNGDIQPDPNV